MGGGAQWDMQRRDQSDRLPLITVDLPGFGAHRDMAPVDTIAGFADWVIADLRAKGVTRYHLLGHSMGGMIAQEIARRDQDNIARLVLYGTGAMGVLPGRFETIECSKARATADGAAATARRIAATWFLAREAAPAYPACATIAEQSTEAAIHAGLNAMQGWSGEGFLPHIRPETLVIWGDQDRTYAWAQTELLWQRTPKASLAVVPGCAHAVHLEKPSLFNALLTDFLREPDQGAAKPT